MKGERLNARERTYKGETRKMMAVVNTAYLMARGAGSEDDELERQAFAGQKVVERNAVRFVGRESKEHGPVRNAMRILRGSWCGFQGRWRRSGQRVGRTARTAYREAST